MSLRSPKSPTSPLLRSLEEQLPERTSRLSLPPHPCSRCHLPFALGEVHVMVDGTSWHNECFRCAQCFEPLLDSIYYNEGGRMYCEHDFHVLFAPFCAKCDDLVVGPVMRAVNGSFHPHCFRCEQCSGSLDMGVWHMDSKMLCYSCKEQLPKARYYRCVKCRQKIEEEELLTHNDDHFHAYHFDCSNCRTILTSAARHIKGDLFCPRCYDMRCDICASCKKPIDKEAERSILAMGKHWHVEHFRCVSCGHAFNGKEHYEKNGKAYCQEDYVKLFGDYCFICQRGLTGESIRLFGKGWCSRCYLCTTCASPLKLKDKVVEFDMRPMCKHCFKNKNYQKILYEKSKEEKTRLKATK